MNWWNKLRDMVRRLVTGVGRMIQYVALGVMLLEVLFGIAAIYVGTQAEHYQRAEADAAMLLIQDADPVYYARLADSTDTSYLRDFYDRFTKRGDPVMLFAGVVMLGGGILGILGISLGLGLSLPITALAGDAETKTGEKPEGGEDTF